MKQLFGSGVVFFWAASFLFMQETSSSPVHLLSPKLYSDEKYSETFTFIGLLQKDMYVQLQLGISNLGIGSQHGFCRALVVIPGDIPWTASEKVSRSKWHVREKPMGLAVDTCHVVQADTTKLIFKIQGATILLEYQTKLEALQPPGNVITSGKTYYYYEILIKHAALQASVMLPGKKGINTSGWGYADHSISMSSPKNIAKRWVRFRALDGNEELLFLGRQTPDEHHWEGWFIAGKKSSFDTISTISLISQPQQSMQPAWMVTASNKKTYLTFEPRMLLHTYAPVSEYGFLGTLAKPFIGDPVTYTYTANGFLNNQQTPLYGVMEITELR